MPETLPLADKLKRTCGSDLIAGFAQLFLSDYFGAIGVMLGDKHFEDVYHNDLPRHDENDSFICKTLYEASQTPEKAKVFYRILTEPFVTMKGVHHFDT